MNNLLLVIYYPFDVTKKCGIMDVKKSGKMLLSGVPVALPKNCPYQHLSSSMACKIEHLHYGKKSSHRLNTPRNTGAMNHVNDRKDLNDLNDLNSVNHINNMESHDQQKISPYCDSLRKKLGQSSESLSLSYITCVAARPGEAIYISQSATDEQGLLLPTSDIFGLVPETANKIFTLASHCDSITVSTQKTFLRLPQALSTSSKNVKTPHSFENCIDFIREHPASY